MKNINMTINSNAIQSYTPPPPAPSQLPSMPALTPVYLVAFNVQFEKQDDAVTFAKIMLQHIQDFDSEEIK